MSQNVTHAIILHGAYGKPNSNWFPWLTDKLNERSISVVAPQLPTPEGQSPSAWLKVLDLEMTSDPKRTVMVGHSLGVAFALRVAERNAGKPFFASLLAAGFWGALGLPDYDPINAPFFAPIDWKKTQCGLGSAICYAADDDPYVPLRFSEEIAQRIEAPLRVLPGRKHLNAESGMVTFPELLTDLDQLIAGQMPGVHS